jgi:hypothetical protein
MDVDTEFRRILGGFTDLTAHIRELDARINERAKLNAILTIWDAIKEDPDAKIPTQLALVIEAARLVA